MELKDITYKGQISWSRTSCSLPKKLYGSDVKTDTPVELVIHRSDSEVRYHEERYFAGDEIIKVQMTPLQWSELLCSGNIANGVPCTISSVNYQKVDYPQDEQSLLERFSMETDESFDSFTKSMNDSADALQEIIDSGKINKKALSDIVRKLRGDASSLPSSLGFLKEQFEKSMASVVVKAKSEVNAYVESQAFERGIGGVSGNVLAIDKE